EDQAMTAPRLARAQQGRLYVWPPQAPFELQVPSSTTILGVLDKPALMGWAARTVAEYAFAHVDAWSRLPRPDAVDLLKGSPWRNRNRKAQLGTTVHLALEQHVSGQAEVDLSEEQEGYYRAARAFLRDFE